MKLSLTYCARLALAATLGLTFAGCDDDDGGKSDAGKTDGGSDAAGFTDAVLADTGTGADVSGDRVTADVSGDFASPDSGPSAAEKIARGKYLVDVVIGCPDCHTPRTAMGALDLTQYLAGDNTPAPMCLFRNPMTNECVHPRNLTNDPTGLKNRTDAEIKAMIRDGNRPVAAGTVDAGAADTAGSDGGSPDANPALSVLSPVMPYYIFKNMAESDLDAIVAYLRTVPGKEKSIPQRGPSWDIPRPAPALNLAKVPMPRADYPLPMAAMRGRYLTSQTGLCLECHTPRLPPGSASVLDEDKMFWGGEDFTGILGPTIPIKSKNLTPDVATGLGSWSFEQIVTAVKQGKDKEGKGICPPMPAGMHPGMTGYGFLTEQDASDIVHYLRSIAPATNMVPDMCTFPPM